MNFKGEKGRGRIAYFSCQSSHSSGGLISSICVCGALDYRLDGFVFESTPIHQVLYVPRLDCTRIALADAFSHSPVIFYQRKVVQMRFYSDSRLSSRFAGFTIVAGP